MANPNPPTTHLHKNYSKWHDSDTVVIRVPRTLRDEILAFAKDLDEKKAKSGQKLER